MSSATPAQSCSGVKKAPPRPRALIALAGLVLLAAGVGLWVHFARPRLPSYHGKTVAEWFHDLGAVGAQSAIVSFSPSNFPRAAGVIFLASNPNRPVFIPPGVPRQSVRIWLANGSLADTPAARAMRAMGTNAVPYLAEQLSRRDGLWARACGKWYPKLPSRVGKFAPAPPPSAEELRARAADLLGLMGHDAIAAVPALVTSLRDSGAYSQSAVLNTLRHLPFEPNELDPMLQELIRKGAPTSALSLITELHLRTELSARILTNLAATADLLTRKRCLAELGYGFGAPQWPLDSVVPALADAMKDPDKEVRRCAEGSLEIIGPSAALALPELMQALQDTDDEVRYGAARALERLGTNGAAAIPALIAATNDASVMVQRASVRAIGNISRAATNQLCAHQE